MNLRKKTRQVTFKGVNISISLDYGLCINCGLCVISCPHNVLLWQENILGKDTHRIDAVQIGNLSKCDSCGACLAACPVKAIKIGEIHEKHDK